MNDVFSGAPRNEWQGLVDDFGVLLDLVLVLTGDIAAVWGAGSGTCHRVLTSAG